MYYAFIDGKFHMRSNHVKYLKSQVDKDMELFNSFSATIYNGKRSMYHRRYDTKWHLLQSTKANRPELPEWAERG